MDEVLEVIQCRCGISCAQVCCTSKLWIQLEVHVHVYGRKEIYVERGNDIRWGQRSDDNGLENDVLLESL